MKEKNKILFTINPALREKLDLHIVELKAQGVKIDRGTLLTILIEMYLSKIDLEMPTCKSTIEFYSALKELSKKI